MISLVLFALPRMCFMQKRTQHDLITFDCLCAASTRYKKTSINPIKIMYLGVFYESCHCCVQPNTFYCYSRLNTIQ